MTKKILFLAVLACTISPLLGQKRIPIGTTSTPSNAEVTLKLTNRTQHYNWNATHENDRLDRNINSPKSANILHKKSKYYINSLEGYATVVYDLNTHKRLKVISHSFNSSNQHLFNDTLFFDYRFRTTKSNFNIFKGKPVEGCFSHNGRYFWVTYYRRSYDRNAIDPSALAIIDTETDKIVRVITTGPLPKKISCSPANKRIAVTHWGDNTVAIIDISADNVNDFRYIKNITIGNKMKLNYDQDEVVNRDKNCGLCLRGTVFSPNSKYLLIGKMGGASIAVIDVATNKHIGNISGIMPNIRHLVFNNNNLYLSINRGGVIQKANFVEIEKGIPDGNFGYKHWQNAKVGVGARTISVHPNGDYLFAAVNNESQISIVRTSDMKVVGTCDVDSYPVGMDICDEGKTLIVTSQGRAGRGGGNSVCIFEVSINK